MKNIKENINQIMDEMNTACKKANRQLDEITLIAVTKTKPIEDMQHALEYGIIDVGENKVQEIRDKYPVFKSKFKWHMIGHLQTNKVKYIIDKVDLIHSVDSIKLAHKINEEAKKCNKIMPILIQINIMNEETKFGIASEEAEDFIRKISELENVRIDGLMTVAPNVSDPEENRAVFRKMKQIYIDINRKNIDNVNMVTLSMGMTNDYKIAIEEGATMVRIGTAIFGKRNYTKG